MTKIVNGKRSRWQDARSWAEDALARARAPQSGQGPVGIYLNDHLAGATGGMELACRLVGSHPDRARGRRCSAWRQTSPKIDERWPTSWLYSIYRSGQRPISSRLSQTIPDQPRHVAARSLPSHEADNAADLPHGGRRTASQRYGQPS